MNSNLTFWIRKPRIFCLQNKPFNLLNLSKIKCFGGFALKNLECDERLQQKKTANKYEFMAVFLLNK